MTWNREPVAVQAFDAVDNSTTPPNNYHVEVLSNGNINFSRNGTGLGTIAAGSVQIAKDLFEQVGPQLMV